VFFRRGCVATIHPRGVSRENGIEFVTIEWVRELARQAHQTTYKLYNVYIIQGL